MPGSSLQSLPSAENKEQAQSSSSGGPPKGDSRTLADLTVADLKGLITGVVDARLSERNELARDLRRSLRQLPDPDDDPADGAAGDDEDEEEVEAEVGSVRATPKPKKKKKKNKKTKKISRVESLQAELAKALEEVQEAKTRRRLEYQSSSSSSSGGESEDGSDRRLRIASPPPRDELRGLGPAIWRRILEKGAGSAVDYLARSNITNNRNKKELEALANVIDHLASEGLDERSFGFMMLVRRFAGVCVADKYGDWDMATVISSDPTDSLLPSEFFAPVLKYSSRLKAINSGGKAAKQAPKSAFKSKSSKPSPSGFQSKSGGGKGGQ